MELFYTRKIDTFVIVSADRDHSHLAKHLVERDFTVVGMSQQQANDDFQSSCTRFIQLDTFPKNETEPNGQPASQPIQRKLGNLDPLLRDLIEAMPAMKGFPIADINVAARKTYGVCISTYPEKTWRAYLLARPDLYICDPKDPKARVRLKQAQTSG
jgi:hypothetical protein